MSVKDLAGRVFQARDVAHSAHWASNSYAEHVALGEFYEGVIEGIDAIVEAYQGEFGKIGPVQVMSFPVPNIVAYLRSELAWIREYRDRCANGSQSIANLIDTLTATYQTTLYKLVNLK